MRPGRKPHTKRDWVFGMVHKVYGLCSGRRFTGDRKAAHRAGHRSRPFKGAQVNPFPANRAACPGAAGGRGAVRRRTAPVPPNAQAVPAPAAGRSRCGPGEGLTGRSG
jgi:hypothetical protein